MRQPKTNQQLKKLITDALKLQTETEIINTIREAAGLEDDKAKKALKIISHTPKLVENLKNILQFVEEIEIDIKTENNIKKANIPMETGRDHDRPSKRIKTHEEPVKMKEREKNRIERENQMKFDLIRNCFKGYEQCLKNGTTIDARLNAHMPWKCVESKLLISIEGLPDSLQQHVYSFVPPFGTPPPSQTAKSASPQLK